MLPLSYVLSELCSVKCYVISLISYQIMSCYIETNPDFFNFATLQLIHYS